MFPISEVLPPLARIKIIDVGAMAVDDLNDAYARLAKVVACEVIGFEPVAQECEKLNRLAIPGRRYLPYVIGDGTEQTFHECSHAMTSSLFEPNTPLLESFIDLAHYSRVVGKRRVVTRRLDDIPEAAGADVLKIDVQGGELMVLHGAVATLRDVVLVHTEAEFVPLYREQPLFGDIDAFMRSQGFILHKIAGVSGRIFQSPGMTLPANRVANQMLWSDVVYVRDFMSLDKLSDGQLLKLAVVLHENYGSHDLAAFALGALDRRSGSSHQPSYVRRLAAARA